MAWFPEGEYGDDTAGSATSVGVAEQARGSTQIYKKMIRPHTLWDAIEPVKNPENHP